MPSKIAKLVQLFESGKMVRIALPGGDSLNQVARQRHTWWNRKPLAYGIAEPNGL